jgi:lipopolysaccharide transport system ATP-binding protein
MSDVVVSVEGLGKRYRIAHQRERYGRLTESLSGAVRAPFDRLRGKPMATTEWFWALRDVAFELRQGTVVGVIGRNGAGKSTLLKILSRITEPTTGTARLNGRTGSLLEVGTGFHPELSGRENIYLSAAVLGMRRGEIDRRFDEIVEFAGVEQFLDTPVKRFSSGMQVRLGFAVAAHLEPEILFVDEVLAVGDASFQAKCLGRMEQIGASGRTVVFVSHSMPAILRLCSQAMLLEGGRVVTFGPTHDVVRTYLHSDLGRMSERRWTANDAPGTDVARL